MKPFRLPAEEFPKAAPSFAGNAALVMIVVIVICGAAAILANILAQACERGICP